MAGWGVSVMTSRRVPPARVPPRHPKRKQVHKHRQVPTENVGERTDELMRKLISLAVALTVIMSVSLIGGGVAFAEDGESQAVSDVTVQDHCAGLPASHECWSVADSLEAVANHTDYARGWNAGQDTAYRIGCSVQTFELFTNTDGNLNPRVTVPVFEKDGTTEVLDEDGKAVRRPVDHPAYAIWSGKSDAGAYERGWDDGVEALGQRIVQLSNGLTGTLCANDSRLMEFPGVPQTKRNLELFEDESLGAGFVTTTYKDFSQIVQLEDGTWGYADVVRHYQYEAFNKLNPYTGQAATVRMATGQLETFGNPYVTYTELPDIIVEATN